MRRQQAWQLTHTLKDWKICWSLGQMDIFFQNMEGAIRISQTHHDNAKIMFDYMREGTFNEIILSFPQLCTLCWLHIEPLMYPK